LELGTLITFDNRDLHERVYLFLRDKILNNELAPGSKIDYDEFITSLGVSRTPLRDAINQLKRDGLIEVRPRSGSYVATPKLKDIEEIYNVRKALECQAIETAIHALPKSVIEEMIHQTEVVEREIKKQNVQLFFESDRHIHRTIITHSGNQLLISIMETLELKIKWFGVIITKNFDRPLQANQYHRKILLALQDGNKEEAKRLMAEHIDDVKEDTIEDYN
jgi:DNA-binding GntR family transcriptional regulator